MNGEQKIIHEELQRSEKRYRMLFQCMQNGFALHEIVCNEHGIPCDYRFLEVNPAFEELTGLQGEVIIGKTVLEVMPSLDQHWIDLYGVVALTGKSTHFEKYSDDLLRYFEIDAYSPQPGQFATIITDVTGRREAEEEFRLSVARFRTVLENAADAVFVANPQGRLIYVNQKACDLVGFRQDELLDKSFSDLAPPMLKEKTQLSFRQALRGKSVLAEASFVHNDGSYIPIDLNVVLLPDGNVYGSCRDISSRKLAEKLMQTMEKQFQQTQKLESLGVLAGGIAHDFNNILTIILGHCYICREDIDSGMSHSAHVLQIETAANRAADLCRQMLAYAGKSEQTRVPVNLWLAVDEIVKMLISAIGKNVTIDLQLKSDVPGIIGDSSQIQQIIMNLITNAAEAIGDSCGTVSVRLNQTTVEAGGFESDFAGEGIHPGQYACLEVSDTGCGMDEETQRRIFEPFYTTKFTGRGLGMSAVLGIIGSHGGALQLSSTLKVGTTIKVYFPLPARATFTDETPEALPTLRVEEHGTVLLVDDEDTLLGIESAMLAAVGFKVTTASDGVEALEIFRKAGSSIDTVLLDVIMPGMSGVDVFKELRKMSATVPIIMVSGTDIDYFTSDIDADEHAAFIRKPYKPEILRDMLLSFSTTER